MLAASLIASLLRADLDHVVVVAAGDAEIELAHAAFMGGRVDGYVSVSDSPLGLVVSRTAGCDELSLLLDDAIDRVVSKLGARELPIANG